jgi:hypothetical protein
MTANQLVKRNAVHSPLTHAIGCRQAFTAELWGVSFLKLHCTLRRVLALKLEWIPNNTKGE